MDFLWRIKSALRRKVDLQASISQLSALGRTWGFDLLVLLGESEVSVLRGLGYKYKLSSISQNEDQDSRTRGG